MDPSQVKILPAGVDIALFQPKEKQSADNGLSRKTRPSQRHSCLPMLQKNCNENIETQLLLIGEGDAFQALKNMSQNDENLDVIGTLPQEELAQKLQKRILDCCLCRAQRFGLLRVHSSAANTLPAV